MATLEELAARLRGQPALVLSGAGLSTESGIPDYRSPAALARPREPMRFQEFRDSSSARQHYWARAHVGWSHMRQVKPNAGHFAVAALQQAGFATGVITQNVDGLQQQAGSTGVLELHGNLRQVRCLNCSNMEAMHSYQARLKHANPGFAQPEGTRNPDGDVELDMAQTAGFITADCLLCGGPMKTDVVFFGENVARPVVERAWQMLDEAPALLVVGSSLTVRSGFRFAEGASEQGKPVYIANDGATRADQLADLKIEGRLGVVLPELVAMLAGHAAQAG